MLRRAVATLTGLGLIGGAGSVVYNHNGDATVKIKDSSGRVQTVHLGGGDGQSFSCPEGTSDKLKGTDIQAGRIKLTLLQLRRQEAALNRRYPHGRGAPRGVIVQFAALVRRDDRLVDAFNAAIDAHNAYLRENCKPAS
jgi:hypothetical protein